MNPILRYLICIALFFQLSPVWGQQKIGLVLSGGGATGFAHIGVIKALEEKGIPIDYITGTSAGALIGSLYAAGISPEEIESYVISEEFQLMSKGKLKASQRYLYKEPENNASLVDFSFSKDSILKKSLPTNFITSSFLDFEMLKLLGPIGAIKLNNFDSLFVPFRCLASDITDKKSVVFESGNLNQAVRASMTYPFYFNPIRINGKLLFDGGLYNNFPADIMYLQFNPDFIIGSNVSYNAAPPMEDDLISQITNMLVSKSDFSLPCDAGLIIEPKMDISTFAFENVREAIDYGYQATIKQLDSIICHVIEIVPKDEIQRRRREFNESKTQVIISSVSTNTLKRKDIGYVRNSLLNTKKNESIDIETLEKRYYRLYATQQIDFMYPLMNLKADSTYNLFLEIRKAKDFKLEVGGHFSSRAVNTGFIGLTYRHIRKLASSVEASSYFGKFYGSAKVAYNLDVPTILPIKSSTYFVMNRWDYFRSFATFFEDVKPSFLIQNELYYGTKLIHPIGNTTKSSIDLRFFSLEDDYYQNDKFTNKDTSDITTFDGGSVSWEFEQNSLNRKQFSTSGHFFKFKVRYVNGHERTTPGSTSILDTIREHDHAWINLNAEFKSYLIDRPHFHFGISGKGVFNSQSLFSNYTATLLALTSFAPIPDAETYFLPEYRSPQYVGGGINAVFTIKKSIDIRFDGYYFQPFIALLKNEDGSPAYSKPFKGDTFMASSSLIYHSFVGPLRFTMNYFPKQVNPLAFQVSFGYVLFNERAIR